MPNYKTVFSLRVRQALRDKGIEPIIELDNSKKKGFKCWVYEETEEFKLAFEELMRGLPQ